MSIKIIPVGNFEEDISSELSLLMNELSSAGFDVKANTLRMTRIKAEIMLGLVIATLAVNTISAFVGVLAIWQSRNKKYKIRVISNEKTNEIPVIDRENIDEITTALLEALNAEHLEFEIEQLTD